MDDLKDIIAKNLTELRTQAKLTQLQLAEMLNYSDKAVSKWERGEAIPDVRVLVQLAEIYGITVDDIIKGNTAPQGKPHLNISLKRVFTVALCVVLVWFVATGVFTLFYFIPATAAYAYLVFVVAPLPTAIVLTVFSVKWGNRVTNAVTSSLILWTGVLIFHIYVLTFCPQFTQIYYLYICAAVFELLIILWFVYRGFASKKTSNRQKKQQ